MLSTCNRTELYVVGEARGRPRAQLARGPARRRRPLHRAQLRRGPASLPRRLRPGLDGRGRGGDPGAGQAGLRARAGRAHDRPADQQALPRGAGDRQAGAHRDDDLDRERLGRVGRGRVRAVAGRRAGVAPRRDRRRRRELRAGRAAPSTPRRHDDVRGQPAARPGDRAGAALRRLVRLLRRAARGARARGRGRLLDGLAARDHRAGGAVRRDGGARRPAAAAGRPGRAARHRSRVRRASPA